MPDVVTQQHSDAHISIFDIHKPEKLNILFRKYGDQGLGFFNVIDTLGYKKPVKQTAFSHFEEDFIHENVEVRTDVADPTVGLPLLFTLATTDLDASNNFYIALGDDVMLANQVTGTVTVVDISTPTAPVITVEPHDSTDNLGAVTAGDKVVIYSNNFAEGTTQPAGKVANTTEFSFSVKIIKVTNTMTGSEMTNQTWFSTMSDGKKIPAYYMKGQFDSEYEMMLRISNAMLFDRATTNTVLTTTNNRTMTGLVPWLRTNGNTSTYNLGFFAFNDFDSSNNTLDQNFAPAELLSLLGLGLMTEWENLFVDTFDQGALVYGEFKGGARKSVDLNIGFKSLTKTERTWHLHNMKVFNHPKLFGSAGFDIANMGVITPMDKKKEATTKNRIPSIGLRYKQLGDYSRKMNVWTTGGAGQGQKTSQTDDRQVNILSECGSQYIAANRFFLWEL